MIRMRFQPPTNHYCESIAPIDEQICELIAKRKLVSGNNPGFPRLELISKWCEQHGLNEDLIRSVFATLYNERLFKARVIPTGFRKFVPIMKSVQTEGVLFMIPYMRQYENASVVYVEIEVASKDEDVRIDPHLQLELFISPEHECRPDRGHGHERVICREFVVVPPLPDDASKLQFRLDIKPRMNDTQVQPRTVVLKETSITVE